MAVEGVVMADEYDPHRCESTIANGQCKFKAIPGSKYCPIHDKQGAKRKTQELHMYLLGQWQARVNEFAQHDDLRTVNQELGLTRMLLEKLALSCKSENELIVNQSKLLDLVERIEHLVVTCNTLEVKTGRVLDKSAILRIAARIIDIITKYITDTELCETIGNEIMETILIEQPITKDEAKE